MLKALVIYPNEKTKDLGDILQIAKSEARRKSHLNRNPPILALEYIPQLDVFVVIYKVDVQKLGRERRGVIGR